MTEYSTNSEMTHTQTIDFIQEGTALIHIGHCNNVTQIRCHNIINSKHTVFTRSEYNV